MKVNAGEVRIPRRVRAAVAHHERVVVLARGRPALVIVHPDDVSYQEVRRDRRVREMASDLKNVPRPDAEFADDLRAIRGDVGSVPDVPWTTS